MRDDETSLTLIFYKIKISLKRFKPTELPKLHRVLALLSAIGLKPCFSSPEHEVFMVSYYDQSLSVVHALSTFCFKRLLLQNGYKDFEIILQEGSLGDPPPKLLKPFRSVEQDGSQS